MNERQPVISVVIPAFNEERFIAACLQSLNAQDFREPFEVIVVDNNSTDQTSLVATTWGARVVPEYRPGVCAARQAGTEAARAEIVISSDADTVFPKDWLSKIWHDFQLHPEVVAVAGSVEYLASPWWARMYSKTLFGIVHLIYKRTGQVKYVTACNTAFRKSAWTGYNIKLAQGGDEFELLSQLKEKGPIFFEPANKVFTSSRRLRQGLIHSLFVTILAYYVFDYWVGRKVGKSLLGSYAPIRQERPTPSRLSRWLQPVALVLSMGLIFSAVIHNARAERLIHRARTGLVNIGSRFDRDERR